MIGPPPPARGPGCPPAVALEQLAADDAQLDAHVASCPACREYVTALRAALLDYRRAHPDELLVAKLQKRSEEALRRRRGWRWALLVPAALSLSLAIVVAWPRDQTIAEKGGRRPFSAVVRRVGGAKVEPLADDSPIERGDQVRFSFDAPAQGQLMVFELDGRDAVWTVFPGGGTDASPPSASAPVGAGPQVLRGAWELSDLSGPEWFIAVYSTQPFEAEAIAAQLRGQATRSRIELRCEVCSWYTLRLRTSRR
jgi:hypothetical protein